MRETASFFRERSHPSLGKEDQYSVDSETKVYLFSFTNEMR